MFIGRTGVEAETPILWPPDAKSWLIRRDPDAGKDWRWEEKGTTEDEMAGWRHWLNEHGFGWTLGVDDGQGGLACGSWGHKESDTPERLSWTELILMFSSSWKYFKYQQAQCCQKLAKIKMRVTFPPFPPKYSMSPNSVPWKILLHDWYCSISYCRK